MTRSKKLASAVSVLALLVLGGVGVVLHNVSASSLYTLGFNANTTDTVNSMPSDVSCTEEAYGCRVTIPTNRPTREGYYFAGWGVRGASEKPEYVPGDTVNLYQPRTTLYAIWYFLYAGPNFTYFRDDETIRVNVGYYLSNISEINYVKIGSYVLSEGTDYDVTLTPDNLKVSYVYIYKSSLDRLDAGNHDYIVGGTSSTGELHALGGVIEVKDRYTLSFDANGGSGAPSVVSCTTTSTSCTVTIPSTIPTRSGYTFKGWANSSSATSANYQAGGTVTLTANKTVYAVWEANSSATSYIFDGIIQPSAITGVANGTAKTAAALGLPSKVTVSLINAGDLTDYPTEQWDVNWNVAGSSYNPSSTAAQTFTVTGTVTLPSNVTNSQGLSTSTTISVSVNAAASKTYTLTFNTNGGTGTVANQSCTTTGSSCTVTIPSTRPTRSGYTFKGWGSSSSTTSVSYQPGNTVTLTANRTLYAVWEQNATPDPDPDPTPDPDPDPDSGVDPDDDSSDGSDSDGSDNNDSNSNSNNSGSNGVAVPDTGANGHDGSNGAEAVWMIAGVAVVVAAGAIVLRHKHTTVDFGKK